MHGLSSEARQRLLGVGGLLAGVLLAGCAPAAPVPAPQTQAAPAGAPKYGGTLQFAQLQNPTSLNPYKGASLAEQAILGPVYETLLKYRYKPGEDYRIDFPIEDSLAERWEQPNETTYVFHVRPGVQWHDGTPFTADDVVWTYTYILDPKNAFPRVSNLRPIKTVEAVDKNTVRITTSKPSPDLLIGIADRIFWILPKHVMDRGDDYEKVVIGTGPYKLQSFERNKGSEVVKNEQYWEKGRPYMQGIKMFLGLESGVMLAAFKTRTQALEYAETTASHLRKIGITMETYPMDRPEFNKVLTDGDYEAIQELIADMSPWQRFQQYFHSKGGLNKMPIRDAKLDELIDKAEVTVNQEERKKLFIEMQQVIESNVYAIPTMDVRSYAARQAYVHDYMYNIGTQTYIYNPSSMWLDVDQMPKR